MFPILCSKLSLVAWDSDTIVVITIYAITPSFFLMFVRGKARDKTDAVSTLVALQGSTGVLGLQATDSEVGSL